MDNLRQLLAEHDRGAANNPLSNDCLGIPAAAIRQALASHDAAISTLRASITSLAIEACVLPPSITEDDASRSMLGDEYYVQLLLEIQLRVKRLSVGYEQLRGVSIPAMEDYRNAVQCLCSDFPDAVAVAEPLLDALQKALDNDLR